MINIIELLSLKGEIITQSDYIEAGYIERHKEMLVKKFTCLKTGISSIDQLDRKTKENIASKTLTKLRKKMRSTPNKKVMADEAQKMLTEILDDVNTNMNKYITGTKPEKMKFVF